MSPSPATPRGRPTTMMLAAVGTLLASTVGADSAGIEYRTAEVAGLKIFYREAGPTDAPTILLLHGFPTSSHMFRDLLPKLAETYHVVAPDYPGYGYSDAPSVDTFDYSFEKLADVVEAFTEKLGLERYSLYIQDFGSPVGMRLATRHPERVEALIVQNAVAHIEGLSPEGFAPARAFWADRNAETEAPMRAYLQVDATKFQYLHGAQHPERISPDAWTFDQALLDRPGNAEIQLALLYDYRNNPPSYPKWQTYLREHRPPTLIVWGRNDPFFTVAGAEGFKRDVPDAELHWFEGGHFMLEEYADEVATLIKTFLSSRLGQPAQ
jgi:pimeloyl-ACP methyl ester carboxylesterase